MEIYIDPELGDNQNPGTIDLPRLTPPPVADGDTWYFARNTQWDAPENWFARTPNPSPTPWSLTVSAYLRPGDTDNFRPIISGDPSFQHTITFINLNLQIKKVKINGGSGSALRIISSRFALQNISVTDCRFIMRGLGKGLVVTSANTGSVEGGLIDNNICRKDPNQPVEERCGDGMIFGGGTRNCTISNNECYGSGHTSFNINILSADEPEAYGNLLTDNTANGERSTHCRGFAVNGVNGLTHDNRVVRNVTKNGSAFDKLNGLRTEVVACRSDYGITASATSDAESIDGICRNSRYRKARIIARHGETVQNPLFSGNDIGTIIVTETSGGIVGDFLFDNCIVSGNIDYLDTWLTIEQANLLPQFNLIRKQKMADVRAYVISDWINNGGTIQSGLAGQFQDYHRIKDVTGQVAEEIPPNPNTFVAMVELSQADFDHLLTLHPDTYEILSSEDI